MKDFHHITPSVSLSFPDESLVFLLGRLLETSMGWGVCFSLTNLGPKQPSCLGSQKLEELSFGTFSHVIIVQNSIHFLALKNSKDIMVEVDVSEFFASFFFHHPRCVVPSGCIFSIFCSICPGMFWGGCLFLGVFIAEQRHKYALTCLQKPTFEVGSLASESIVQALVV